jgi:hypothetical protein
MVEIVESYDEESGEIKQYILDDDSFYDLEDWTYMQQTKKLLSKVDDSSELREFYSWLLNEVVEKLRILGFENTYPREVKKEDLKRAIDKALNDISNFILEKYGYHYYYPREFLPYKDRSYYKIPQGIEQKVSDEELHQSLTKKWIHPSLVKFAQAYEKRTEEEQLAKEEENKIRLERFRNRFQNKGTQELALDSAKEIVRVLRSKGFQTK